MCTEVITPSQGSISGIQRIWGYRGDKWNKDELTICFLNGSDKQHEKTKRYAEEWLKYCGLKFIWLDKPDQMADIRISYRCGGHWSYVGRGNLNVARNKATMDLELSSWDSNDEWRRVVLHEFGHAIGFQHEQFHPETDLKPDEKKVLYYYMSTQGWSEKMVRQQVLSKMKVSPSQFIGSEYDRTSIMHYPFPAELTVDGRGVGWNTELSDKDKELVAKMYPKE